LLIAKILRVAEVSSLWVELDVVLAMMIYLQIIFLMIAVWAYLCLGLLLCIY